MLSLLACFAIGQVPTQLTVDEVRQRLEYPVTYKSDPIRLPVALDEVGRMVGVRIRCESELQPAVVVVGVKNKPAKEVVQHLVSGVGAGSAIINGTLVVGMGITTSTETARQKERQLQAIKNTLDARAKQLKVDEPVDLQAATRTAALIVPALQVTDGSVRPPYQLVQETSQKAPVHRAVVELLRVVGPGGLRPEDDRPLVVSMRELDPERARKAQAVLDKFAREQSPWAKAFEQVMKLAANSGEGYYWDLLNKSISVDETKPDNFRITVTNTSWGRTVMAEIRAGSEELFSVGETLPRERIYTNPGGEYFPYTKAAGIKVSLGELATHLFELRRAASGGKQVPYEANLMKKIADPFRNEPLALTLAQPAAEVADRLGLNIVAFVGDSLLNSVVYGNYNLQDNQVPGEQVLSLVGNMGGTLRKRGDWLLGYCANPEAYLENQIDRVALGKFLGKALKPGALTFDQFLAARKEMSLGQLAFARQFARIVRPGFDSLNPVSIEMLELFQSLKPGQMTQAENGGIPFANLAPDIQIKFRGYISHQRRRQRFQPDDSIDAPPTQQEILSSRVFLVRSSRYGVLTLQGADLKRSTYNPYVNYSFHDFNRYRGIRNLDDVMAQFRGQAAWQARMDTMGFTVDITRRRPQGFTTSQYITDITTTPLSEAQVAQAIARYFQSGG
jgi:hypothetical protein